MKVVKWFSIIAILFLLQAGSILAQETGSPRKADMNTHKMGMKMHQSGIPNLTPDQEIKIKEFRTAFQKELQPLRNQMGELKARQKTLTTVDKPDTKAINSNIDEITKLQNQMMKATVNHRLQIRSILNDEQKLFFDTHGKAKNRGEVFGKGRHFRV